VAAYRAYTRTALGGLTETHLLLVRDSHTLPDDERISIDMMRQGIGELLGGNLREETLRLLDAPFLDAPAIEARLGRQSSRHPRRGRKNPTPGPTPARAKNRATGFFPQASPQPQRPAPGRQTDKSFLVLFFKKELLP
jgi:hypothetical protein